MKKLILLSFLILIFTPLAYAQIFRSCEIPFKCNATGWKCPGPFKKWFDNMDKYLAWAKDNPHIEHKIGYWPIDDLKSRQIIYWSSDCEPEGIFCQDDNGQCLR